MSHRCTHGSNREIAVGRESHLVRPTAVVRGRDSAPPFVGVLALQHPHVPASVHTLLVSLETHSERYYQRVAYRRNGLLCSTLNALSSLLNAALLQTTQKGWIKTEKAVDHNHIVEKVASNKIRQATKQNVLKTSLILYNILRWVTCLAKDCFCHCFIKIANNNSQIALLQQDTNLLYATTQV